MIELFNAAADRAASRISSNLSGYNIQKLRQLMEPLKQRVVNEVARSAISDAAFPDIIHPLGTRLFKVRNGHVVLVVEEKPQIRTVSFVNKSENLDRTMSFEGIGTTPTRFSLGFPYVLFVFLFQPTSWGVRIYYRKAPLRDITDDLCFSNLPNVNTGDAHLCTGQSLESMERYTGNPRDITKFTEKFMVRFWESPFNNDWIDNFRASAAKDERLSSLQRWQEASRNPMFALNAKWRPAQRQLAEVVANCLGSNVPNALAGTMERSLKAAFEELAVSMANDISRVDFNTFYTRYNVDSVAEFLDRLVSVHINQLQTWYNGEANNLRQQYENAIAAARTSRADRRYDPYDDRF